MSAAPILPPRPPTGASVRIPVTTEATQNGYLNHSIVALLPVIAVRTGRSGTAIHSTDRPESDRIYTSRRNMLADLSCDAYVYFHTDVDPIHDLNHPLCQLTELLR